VGCLIAQAAAKRPRALALREGERSWTWAELDADVGRRVAQLEREGLGRGARYGALTATSADLVAAFFACQRLGLTLVPFNVRLTAAELAPLVARAALAGALASPRHVEALAGVTWAPRRPPGEGEPPALALFTSGTTGAPKLVYLGRDQLEASARAAAQRVPVGADDRWLLTMPLFHVGGLAMLTRWALAQGTLELHPGFDEAAVWRALDGGATQVSLVAQTLRRLLRASPASAPRSLRAVLVGGGPCPPGVIAEARERGFPVLQTYGLTEACSQVCTEVPGAADGSTCGPPLPGVRVEIRDESGAQVPPSVPGRIFVAGPTVSPPLGPWLDTGDFGQLDAGGRLSVLSRREDLIISGGENVYPAELERVISSHPAVEEVAVIPIADERWGQAGLAAVVLRPRGELGELERWARGRLAAFRVPKQWRRLDALPRTPTGKLDRPALRRALEG